MKVFYHCYGSAHSSVVAAAIHLKLLPSDRVPSAGEIDGIKHYDRVPNSKVGTAYFMGLDEDGNEVYIIGMGGAPEVVKRALTSVAEILGTPASELFFVNTLSAVHPLTRIGGFMSRRLGLVGLGRPLTIAGVRLSYHEYAGLVSGAKRNLTSAKALEDNKTD